MKEATPLAEKLIPPLLNKRAVNHSKDPKQPAPQETECAPEKQENSPLKKRKKPSKPTTTILESADLFGDTTAGEGQEISLLFSEFAEVLSDRVVADTSQMKELEDILTEAQNLESFLKEKKRHLRQTLDLISNKLQG